MKKTESVKKVQSVKFKHALYIGYIFIVIFWLNATLMQYFSRALIHITIFKYHKFFATCLSFYMDQGPRYIISLLREPCVFSYLINPFLGWPASQSLIWEIFSVRFCHITFRGASCDMVKPSQPSLLYHLSDCVFHLKGFAGVIVSKLFSARHP